VSLGFLYLKCSFLSSFTPENRRLSIYLEKLREIDGLSDSKRISLCSEYTKLYDLGTFNQAFTKKNNKLSNLAERLKKKTINSEDKK